MNLDMMRLQRSDAMPVLLLHPAIIVRRVLWAVVHNHPLAQYLYILNLPQIQAADNHRSRREIVGFAALGIEIFLMHPRRDHVKARLGHRRLRWNSHWPGHKHKQHVSVVEKIPRPGDGNLSRVLQLEFNGVTLALGPYPKPPRLDIHATIPEAALAGRYRDRHRPGALHAHVVVAGGSMGHIHWLAVDLYMKLRGAHFLRYGDRRNPGLCVPRGASRENHGESNDNQMAQVHCAGKTHFPRILLAVYPHSPQAGIPGLGDMVSASPLRNSGASGKSFQFHENCHPERSCQPYIDVVSQE